MLKLPDNYDVWELFIFLGLYAAEAGGLFEVRKN
jgi:hypothetical protein